MSDKPEERTVCSACGHIDGAHLDHCRIAALESRLAEMKRKITRLESFDWQNAIITLTAERDTARGMCEGMVEALRKVSYFEDDLCESLWDPDYKEWRKQIRDSIAAYDESKK